MKLTDHIINGKEFVTFESYCEELYNILQESPYLKIDSGRGFDSFRTNETIFKRNLKEGKIKKIGNFVYSHVMFDVYEGKTFQNSKELEIVDRTENIIAGVFNFTNIDNNTIQETGVWQKKEYRGLIREFYINWILKQWNLMSDAEHSEYAKNMWSHIISEILTSYNVEYKVIVINTKDNTEKEFTNIEEFDSMYGVFQQQDLVFKIIRK